VNPNVIVTISIESLEEVEAAIETLRAKKYEKEVELREAQEALEKKTKEYEALKQRLALICPHWPCSSCSGRSNVE